MHSLISQDQKPIADPEPAVLIDPIYKQPDEKIIERRDPPAKPERKEPPQAIRDVPDEAEPTLVAFNPHQTIDRVKITPNVNAGNRIDRQTSPIVRVPPEYPLDARRDGIEGYVQLQFNVNKQGEVTDIEVIDAKPKRIFERAAKRSLAKWKYRPKTEKGVPMVQTGLTVMLEFKLGDY
jgi:protein TonB